MAKICIGCGLKTDLDGNLIVDTNEATWPASYPTATCPDSSGTPVYCTADGSLHGPAEKFSTFDRRGKNFVTDSPVRMTSLVAQDGKLYALTSTAPPGITPRNSGNAGDNTPLKFTIANPSKCLPFNVYLEAGISHAYLNWLTGDNGGDMQVELATYVTVTGATEAFSNGAGHQIWGGTLRGQTGGEGIVFDTMGARATVNPPSAATKFVVPAGGAMIVTVYPLASLIVNGAGTRNIDLQNFTIDCNWWGSND